MLGVPALTVVPRSRPVLRERSRLVMLNHPSSPAAEAFRTLRAGVLLADGAANPGRIICTSAVAGEGKTFTAVNFSIALAQQGRRTLLIDLDFRRPAVSETFGWPASRPGVADYVLKRASFADIVTTSPVEKLSVIPAGSKITNPAETLNAPEIAQLLDEAGNHYDCVILDTAPINPVADTLNLLPHTKFLLLVIESGRTPIKTVQRAMTILERAGATPRGLVINRVATSRGRGYYYYSTKNAYGTPEGYGAG